MQSGTVTGEDQQIKAGAELLPEALPVIRNIEYLSFMEDMPAKIGE